jgi:hypothetical protein
MQQAFQRLLLLPTIRTACVYPTMRYCPKQLLHACIALARLRLADTQKCCIAHCTLPQQKSGKQAYTSIVQTHCVHHHAMSIYQSMQHQALVCQMHSKTALALMLLQRTTARSKLTLLLLTLEVALLALVVTMALLQCQQQPAAAAMLRQQVTLHVLVSLSVTLMARGLNLQ